MTKMHNDSNDTFFARILWLWFPVLFLPAWILFEHNGDKEWVQWSVSESGAVEILQALITLMAFVAALRVAFKMDRKTHKALFSWFCAGALGSLYIFGEEISWGQWIAYWETPEGWKNLTINKKQICIMFRHGLTRNRAF